MSRSVPDELVIALVGQPNCGKSSLFNAVAGFKVATGNFAGTTVSYTETSLVLQGRAIRLIDLPGTYSLSSLDPAEKVARDFLLSGEVDVVINVNDSSLLSRSLELSLQLVEMGCPMVVCLNMMDEAKRKGIEIDVAALSERLGVAVCPVIAVLGTGIEELFEAALAVEIERYAPVLPVYPRDVEEHLARALASFPDAVRSALGMNDRFVVLRLFEGDEELEARVGAQDGAFLALVRAERHALGEEHAGPSAAGRARADTAVLSSQRHALVLDLYEAVATHHGGTRLDLRERIDRFITDPVGGLVTVLGSLLLTFYLAFFFGDAIAGLVEGPFDAMRGAIDGLGKTLPVALLSGLADGFVAGAGIVLPYLVPLLFLLAIYEDTGLLPRIAFLVDGLLHRVGLHGKSVVPLILGFGCNVPAVMATRNLENPRDRLVTMLVIPFVTCSARSVVILALAGRYLGAGWALGFYVLGIVVSMGVSFALTRSRRHRSLGVIMEVPQLRRPYPRIVGKKVWHRLREFIVVAWPVLIVSSVALAALGHYGLSGVVNRALSPLTVSLLQLPEVIGIALFLGLLRKELTLVMLATALGTADTGAVLDRGQILVLVTFTVLYIPCAATLAAIWKEGGWRTCVGSAVLNFGVAVTIAGIVARIVH